MKRKKTIDCLDDDLIFRYFQGTLSRAERASLMNHLNSCDACLREMTSLVKDVIKAKREVETVEAIDPLKLEKQVSKILQLVEANKASEGRAKMERKTILAKRQAESGEPPFSFFQPGFRIRLVIIGLGLLSCLVLGYFQFINWQSQIHTRKGLSYLLNSHRVTMEEFRLTGGFAPTISYGYRDFQEDTSSGLAQAAFQKALRYNSNNVTAQQYLGTLYFLSNHISKAESLYTEVLSQVPTRAEIYNDLGIIAFKKGTYESAENYFLTALQYNSKLNEAQYNLALLYQSIGLTEKAKAEWRRYLEFESSPDWIKIAGFQLKNLLDNSLKKN